MSVCLGLDTSNYTTSVALFGGVYGHNLGRLLEVPAGGLGLRQSDALFQHIKQLPLLIEQLREEGRLDQLDAVGASTQPRAVEGSYMPCFWAGESLGRSLAGVLGVPFIACSHQQGHIAAATWSADRIDLLEMPHLAWHLSGGTTELLYVEPEGAYVRAERIGGTSDISAGQLIDRTGVRLGLAFPAGKALDALAKEADKGKCYSVKVRDLTFSLSGVENQIQAMTERGESPAVVAAFTLDTVASAVARTTAEAQKRWLGLPLLCSGGVASNCRLRSALPNAIFAPPQYSTDNALGVSILAHRELKRRDQT